MSHFAPYSVGTCYASVCTDLPVDDAARELNRHSPTGIAPWKKSDELFAGGEPNPCPCPDGQGRQHYLFAC